MFRSNDKQRRNGFQATVVCLPPPSSSLGKRQTGDNDYDDFVSWLVVFKSLKKTNISYLLLAIHANRLYSFELFILIICHCRREVGNKEWNQ